MLLPENELQLWQRIVAFPVDDPEAYYPFSRKLAAEQGWAPAFCEQVIGEYKKFMLLCCVLPHGASPSPLVDAVWHLHLTYTRSYWTDFCRNTLGKDIHHHPSAGGPDELQKHRQWYADTLVAYARIFEMAPPANIWPAPVETATAAEITELPVTSGAMRNLLVMAVAFLFIPLLANVFLFGEWNPFALSGPHFLGFFAMYCTCVMLPYVWYLKTSGRWMERQITPMVPPGLNVFQAAAIIEGKHRATQTAILDLLQRELIGMSTAGFHIQTGMEQEPAAGEPNPLRLSLRVAYPPGSIVDYHCMLSLYTSNEGYMHRGLQALEGAVRDQVKDHWKVPGLALIAGVAGARMIQGVQNQRPVEGLFIEAIIAILVFSGLSTYFNKHSAIDEGIQAAMRQRLKDDHAVSLGQDATLYRFALEGTPAIAGRMNGALLIALLGAFAAVNADQLIIRGSNGSNRGGGGSSSDGGGGGGGGGCGGCSGA